MAYHRTTTTVKLQELSGWAEQMAQLMPHLYAVIADEEDFRGLNCKAKDDGTTLAVVKRFGPDGTPQVCFGVGYGFFGALYAIDRTIQGGNWKFDKPWEAKATG